MCSIYIVEECVQFHVLSIYYISSTDCVTLVETTRVYYSHAGWECSLCKITVEYKKAAQYHRSTSSPPTSPWSSSSLLSSASWPPPSPCPRCPTTWPAPSVWMLWQILTSTSQMKQLLRKYWNLQSRWGINPVIFLKISSYFLSCALPLEISLLTWRRSATGSWTSSCPPS